MPKNENVASQGYPLRSAFLLCRRTVIRIWSYASSARFPRRFNRLPTILANMFHIEAFLVC